MKKIGLILLLVFAIEVGGFAQMIKAGTKILYTPKWAKNPTGLEISGGPAKGEKDYWTVFSDRMNNVTIPMVGANRPHKTLNFGEAFFVIEEKVDYIHIIKWEDDICGSTKNIILRATEDYGWIRKITMQCSQYTLESSKGISRKAISIVNDETGEVIKHPEKYINEGDKISFYNDPNLVVKNGNDVKFFNFLFVYKEELNSTGGKSYLIGTNEKFGPITFKSQILGWVSEKLIFIWPTRMCIEPNSNTDAIKERKEKNLAASMFIDKSKAESFSTGNQITADNVVDNFERKMEPHEFRYPIFKQWDNIYQTGFQTDIMDKKGVQQATVQEAAVVRADYNALRASSRKYNFVFVLSANEAIRTNFYNNISSSIREISKYVKSSEIDKKCNFAVVIYGGTSECEPKSSVLSNSEYDIISFIENNQGSLMCLSSDQKTENVLGGMERAYHLLSKCKNEINVIINVGFAPNSKNIQQDVYDKLAAKLADIKCAVVAMLPMISPPTMQVNTLFLSNSKDLLMAICKNTTSNINKTNDKDLALKGTNIPNPLWKNNPNDEDNFYFDFPNKSPMSAAVLTSANANVLSSQEIVDGILNVIKDLDVATQGALDALSSKFDGMGAKMIKLNPLVLSMYASLKDFSTNVSINESNPYEKLMNSDNFQLFIRSYTSITSNKLTYPLFTHVIFVTQREYDNLNEVFQKILTSGGSSVARTRMQDAFKEIVKTYYGKEANKIMANASVGTIVELVTGLPSRSEIMKKTTVNGITDMSEPDFKRLEQNFKVKIQKYGEIAQNARYRLETGDQRFYWIPEDYLP